MVTKESMAFWEGTRQEIFNYLSVEFMVTSSKKYQRRR
jgi:hypothetical protein